MPDFYACVFSSISETEAQGQYQPLSRLELAEQDLSVCSRRSCVLTISADSTASRSGIKSPISGQERLAADDVFPTLERAADALAGEQSCGTFVAVPGETDSLRERFRARIERISPLSDVSTPSLPGRYGESQVYHRGEVVVSFVGDVAATDRKVLLEPRSVAG